MADSTPLSPAADPVGTPLRVGGGPRRIPDPTEWLERVDTEQIRAEVEDRIRARPLLSIAVAVVAGFIIGRALRD